MSLEKREPDSIAAMDSIKKHDSEAQMQDSIEAVDSFKKADSGAQRIRKLYWSKDIVSKIITDSISRDSMSLPTIQKAKGSLVYYCPGRMIENTDNNVSVTITKTAISQAINQIRDRVAAKTGMPIEKIQKNISGNSMIISNKMKVELKFADKNFETVYKPENDDQIFDGTNDMTWDWIIKPLKVGLIQLSLIVSAYDEKNGRWIAAETPPKIFNIKVQVDPRSYFSKLWSFLEVNPEWIFIQILFPVTTFFIGRSKRKKSK